MPRFPSKRKPLATRAAFHHDHRLHGLDLVSPEKTAGFTCDWAFARHSEITAIPRLIDGCREQLSSTFWQ